MNGFWERRAKIEPRFEYDLIYCKILTFPQYSRHQSKNLKSEDMSNEILFLIIYCNTKNVIILL
jgi:hypothetical protein